MRESNHNHPQQNRACVCITSQLYDRRALDAPVSSAPLISSLTHLAYLTSTSPRIRETLTVDGGLERLSSIASTALAALEKPTGSEKLSSSAAAVPDKAKTAGAPFRSFASYSQRSPSSAQQDQGSSSINRPSARANCTDQSNQFRAYMITYTLSLQSLVNVGVRGSEPVRTRCVEAGVLSVAEQILKGYFDEREATHRMAQDLRTDSSPAISSTARTQRHRDASAPAPSTTSAMLHMQMEQQQPTPIASTSLNTAIPPVVAPISISPSSLAAPAFASSSTASLTSLEPSAFSSRANTPDGVPSSSSSSVAADDAAASSSDGEADQDEQLNTRVQATAQRRARSATIKIENAPRPQPQPTQASTSRSHSAASMQLQDMDMDNAESEDGDTEMGHANHQPEEMLPSAPLMLSPAPTIRATPTRRVSDDGPAASPTERGRLRESVSASAPLSEVGHHYFFRDDDLLLCLQLLAYLSKYPHVRAAFHHPCIDFACGDPNFLETKIKGSREKHPGLLATLLPIYAASNPQLSNIFSLVERFTVRPPVNDRERMSPPPLQFSSDISYWAGVIMRNACRKDEGRGGIRQCANMACGAWETYPREFAKCRRCRKAKYCSKACQSKAWQGGHRYWCSAREMEQQESHAHRRSERDTPRASAFRWPYQGTLAPLARLPESDAAALARYLEGHPGVAQSTTAVADLVRRYQARQRTASTTGPARPTATGRPRARANSLPGTTMPLSPPSEAAITTSPPVDIPAPPTFLLRGTFQENEETDYIEAQSDNMVHIAEPDAEQHGELRRVEVQDLTMV